MIAKKIDEYHFIYCKKPRSQQLKKKKTEKSNKLEKSDKKNQ